MNIPPVILHSDSPTVYDRLDWQSEVQRIAQRIKECHPPHIMGIHGDWGSGKTSFMRQVQRALGAEIPLNPPVDGDVELLPEKVRKELQKSVVSIWFDAWQYQNEPVPIVALLHEMRRQMSTIPSIATALKKLVVQTFLWVSSTLSRRFSQGDARWKAKICTKACWD